MVKGIYSRKEMKSIPYVLLSMQNNTKNNLHENISGQLHGMAITEAAL